MQQFNNFTNYINFTLLTLKTIFKIHKFYCFKFYFGSSDDIHLNHLNMHKQGFYVDIFFLILKKGNGIPYEFSTQQFQTEKIIISLKVAVYINLNNMLCRRVHENFKVYIFFYNF